jgi:hypothetical protein
MLGYMDKHLAVAELDMPQCLGVLPHWAEEFADAYWRATLDMDRDRQALQKVLDQLLVELDTALAPVSVAADIGTLLLVLLGAYG